MLKRLPIILAILMLIWVVNAGETLTKNNFAEIPSPNLKDYYFPGEEISFNITIKPKTEEDYTKLDERTYEFYTDLELASLKVKLVYRNDGAIYKVGKDYLGLEVKQWEDGVESIRVEVSGKVPYSEERLKKIFALRIEVTDAESNVLPNFTINVVNTDAFQSYISKIESRYAQLSNNISKLEAEGYGVSQAKKLLKSAELNLTKGKDYFNSKEYIESENALMLAEKSLDRVEGEIYKAKVKGLLESARNKLDALLLKLTELEALVIDLRNAGGSTTLYEIKVSRIKTDYGTLSSKLDNAENYINQKLYDDARSLINSVLDDINKDLSEIDSMIVEVNSKISELEKPTETATPVESFMPDISAVGDYIYKYGKFVIVLVFLIVIVFASYKGAKRYMKRRKWDELK